MREIKFRGKTANGEWVYGSLIYSDNIEPAIYFEFGKGTVKTFDFVYVKPETVGQYIGQKDKNGKKIFEGDILHCKYNHHKYLVKINEYGVYTRDERGEELKLGRIHNDFEIVGNVHDNPELLGGK